MAVLSEPPQGGKPYEDDFYISRFRTAPILNPQPWQMADYTMLERIAKTSTTEVWRASHPLYPVVAVKLMGVAGMERGHITDKRLANEFLILADLHHPNIARTFGHGTWNELRWTSMEYIPGGTLAALINMHPHQAKLEGKRPLHPSWAVGYVHHLARALEYAHLHGILHRDVKPTNILLREKKGRDPVLVDFGIAYMMGTGRMTLDGKITGTPEYMSPEQCTGEDLDARTDIYSLGIVLYELLAGAVPFKHEIPLALCYMQVHNPIPPLPSFVHPALAAVCMKAVAKRREDRYQTALEFADALIPFVEVR